MTPILPFAFLILFVQMLIVVPYDISFIKLFKFIDSMVPSTEYFFSIIIIISANLLQFFFYNFSYFYKFINRFNKLVLIIDR